MRRVQDRRASNALPGGEAPARCARELTRPPSRGERGKARQGSARAAATGRRRAPGVGGGLHAAREQADRRGARAARHGPGGRARAGGESPRAEAGRAARSRRRRRRRRKGGGAAAKAAQAEAERRWPRRSRNSRRKPKPPRERLTQSTDRALQYREAPQDAGPPALSPSSSSSSRSRRNRVSSAARLSPDGSSPAASIRSTRRSSSST